MLIFIIYFNFMEKNFWSEAGGRKPLRQKFKIKNLPVFSVFSPGKLKFPIQELEAINSQIDDYLFVITSICTSQVTNPSPEGDSVIPINYAYGYYISNQEVAEGVEEVDYYVVDRIKITMASLQNHPYLIAD